VNDYYHERSTSDVADTVKTPSLGVLRRRIWSSQIKQWKRESLKFRRSCDLASSDGGVADPYKRLQTRAAQHGLPWRIDLCWSNGTSVYAYMPKKFAPRVRLSTQGHSRSSELTNIYPRIYEFLSTFFTTVSSCTVSKLQRNSGRKLPIILLPRVFNAPPRGYSWTKPDWLKNSNDGSARIEKVWRYNYLI